MIFTLNSLEISEMKPVKRKILLSPGPTTTTDTVKYAQIVPDICPREKEFCDLSQSICHKLNNVVNGGNNFVPIIFGCSGTGAVEAALTSVVPEHGKVLIHINGAYGMRMYDIAKCYFKPEQILLYKQNYGNYPDLEKFKALFTKYSEITHLAFVHNETTTGMLNPASEILELAHQHGIQVILDAISSYAGIPIDLQQEPYDYLIASSNKCIQGMAGVGFVIANRKSLSTTASIPVRNYYFNLWKQHDFFDKTEQMRFTSPVQVFYALNQALDEFFEETQKGRYDRYCASWEALIKGLDLLNLQPLLPLKWHSKIITAIKEPTFPNYNFNQMHDYLYEQGFTIYPGKIANINNFRIANIGAITKEDIKELITKLERYFHRLYSYDKK